MMIEAEKTVPSVYIYPTQRVKAYLESRLGLTASGGCSQFVKFQGCLDEMVRNSCGLVVHRLAEKNRRESTANLLFSQLSGSENGSCLRERCNHREVAKRVCSFVGRAVWLRTSLSSGRSPYRGVLDGPPPFPCPFAERVRVQCWVV